MFLSYVSFSVLVMCVRVKCMCAVVCEMYVCCDVCVSLSYISFTVLVMYMYVGVCFYLYLGVCFYFIFHCSSVYLRTRNRIECTRVWLCSRLLLVTRGLKRHPPFSSLTSMIYSKTKSASLI